MGNPERYGYPHQKLRREWAPRVEGGSVACSDCGFPIAPGEPWDLGHDRVDRSRWIGPSHRRCNRNTGLEKRLRGRKKRRWRSDLW